jgi:hypothetical protein
MTSRVLLPRRGTLLHQDALPVLEVRSFTIDVRLDEGQVVVAHTYFDEADVIEQVLRN